jgi:HCOMODA/2-hydroxy-3-carboxy-muconic semialdehyde decarboxylase
VLRPLTQIITGQSPESSAFRRRYDAFLVELSRSILTKRTDDRTDTPDTDRELHRTLRMAARALSSAGLVTAYGHCSIRRDESTFLVTPVVPLGQIARQPGIIVPMDGDLPDDVPGEVRMHQAIYRRRNDVGGIARVLSTAVRALSVLGLTARPLDGTGSYFAPGPPMWSDPGLVRTAKAADGVADALADAPAIVLRGNGAVVVGETLPRAVVLAQFLETASELDLAARATGNEAIKFTQEEVAARAVWTGGIEERMWTHLTRNDSEIRRAGEVTSWPDLH